MSGIRKESILGFVGKKENRDDYYYTVEAKYNVFDSNNANQILVYDLDHTLIDKGSVNTYSTIIHYIGMLDDEENWMPPSDNMILFLIIFIYCYIQLAALFIGWPTKMITDRRSAKSKKTQHRLSKNYSTKSKEP